MVNCDYCHNEISKIGLCSHCGKTIYSAGGRIIYGATVKEICACEVTITEKYLIIRKVSKAEARGAKLGNAGGLLGAVIADAARNSVSRPHGFYALSNIRKGIFPYRTSGIKRNNAIKLINKDGTDFILIFDQPGFIESATKVMNNMIGYIRAAIPEIEDGARKNHGAVHCANPYVTLENLDKITSSYIPKVTAEPVRPATVPKSAVNPSDEERTLPIITPPSDNIRTNSTNEPIITPPPANFCTNPNAEPVKVNTNPTEKPTKVRCIKCGNYVFADRNFCNKCGARIVHEIRCTLCSKVLEEGDIYCSYCGHKVDV